jgi:hypothetical protein
LTWRVQSEESSNDATHQSPAHTKQHRDHNSTPSAPWRDESCECTDNQPNEQHPHEGKHTTVSNFAECYYSRIFTHRGNRGIDRDAARWLANDRGQAVLPFLGRHGEPPEIAYDRSNGAADQRPLDPAWTRP